MLNGLGMKPNRRVSNQYRPRREYTRGQDDKKATALSHPCIQARIDEDFIQHQALRRERRQKRAELKTFHPTFSAEERLWKGVKLEPRKARTALVSKERCFSKALPPV